MTLSVTMQPATPTLPPRDEPQLCYILVTVSPREHAPTRQAVHWALVADASISMRIPILPDETFRELVRQGGAQEILVDGIPAWKFTKPVPQEIQDAAPSALTAVARALHSVVEQLENTDRFTLVACAEEARVLLAGTSGVERAALVYGINELPNIPPGEQTDLAQGLRLALAELATIRRGSSERIERLLLLTDGFTQDPDACKALALDARAAGVAISTIGLGGEFQEDLLTALADLSGGNALFLAQTADIPRAVAQELTAARKVVARSVTLHMTLSKNVELRRATRISPALTPLSSVQDDERSLRLSLGDIERGEPVRVLLELLAPPLHLSPQADTQQPPNARRLRLAQFALSSRGQTTSPLARYPHDIIVTCTTDPLPLPSPVVDAATRANAALLQRRAMDMAASGNHQQAAILLRTVAARLDSLGETDLANRVLQEAVSLETTGATTPLATKELTYATRRLGR